MESGPVCNTANEKHFARQEVERHPPHGNWGLQVEVLQPRPNDRSLRSRFGCICVIVKIMVPFWVLKTIRHLVFRGPKRDHHFDNHPYVCGLWSRCIGKGAGQVVNQEDLCTSSLIAYTISGLLCMACTSTR